ncbi:MAG: RNA polymerase sigma factor [Planctomycetota bacterium]
MACPPVTGESPPADGAEDRRDAESQGSDASSIAPRFDDHDEDEAELFRAHRDDATRFQKWGTDPDDGLVDRARDGDELAFEELVLKHQDRVFSRVYFLVHDRQLAEDLAQETFLRAFLGLRGFREAARFSTWLAKIAVNVVYHHFERNAAQKRSARVVSLERARGEPPLEVADSRPLPDEWAALGEQRALILAAVARLPEEYRLTFALRELDGHSYEEISYLLGVPIGSVKSRLFRARQLLQEMLKDRL